MSCNCKVWLQNIVKCRKYSPAKLANFVYFCITHGKALPLHMWKCGNAFSRVIQKKTKFSNFTLHIFNILQYFTTKPHNFTKFSKLFVAVLKLFSNSKVCLIGEWSIFVTYFLPTG